MSSLEDDIIAEQAKREGKDADLKHFEEALQRLADRGIDVSVDRGRILPLDVPQDRNREHRIDLGSDHVRIGVVSDTHQGSKFEQLTALRAFYAYADEREVDFFVHAGDFVQGSHRMHLGMEHELHAFGADAQTAYVARTYPVSQRRVPTYAISGNHDDSFLKDGGVNVVRNLASQRDDICYVAQDAGYLTIGNLRAFVIHPDGGGAYAKCHDGETEILTRTLGWVRFADLPDDAEVATLSAVGNLQWQRPTDYTAEPYQGDLIRFGGGRTSGYELLVTPQHRMWVRRVHQGPNGRGYQFVTASDVKGRAWRLQRGLGWTCTFTTRVDGFEAHDYARFLGWYMSEGSCSPWNNQIQIAQLPSRYYEEIAQAIERLGFNAHRNKNRICFSDKAMADRLKPFGHAEDKWIPQWIKDAQPSVIEAFLDAFWKGDGTFVNGEPWTASTASRRLADDLQECILKVGRTSVVQAKPGLGNRRPIYVVSSRRGGYERTIEKEPERVPYSGTVYCVTVPNGVILTRRNGKPAWSGNSYKPQKIAESLPVDKNLAVILIGHYHQYGSFKHQRAYAFMLPCFQSQYAWLARKGLHPDIGGVILDLWLDDDGWPRRVAHEFVDFKPLEDDWDHEVSRDVARAWTSKGLEV